MKFHTFWYRLMYNENFIMQTFHLLFWVVLQFTLRFHCFNFKCEELNIDSLNGYIAFILNLEHKGIGLLYKYPWKNSNTDFANFKDASDPQQASSVPLQFCACSRHSIKVVEWMGEGMHKCPLWISGPTFLSLSLDDLRSTSSK